MSSACKLVQQQTNFPSHSVAARTLTESRSIALIKAGAGKGRAVGSSLPSRHVRDLEVLDTRPTSLTTLASSADVVAAVLRGAAFGGPRLDAPRALQVKTSVVN